MEGPSTEDLRKQAAAEPDLTEFEAANDEPQLVQIGVSELFDMIMELGNILGQVISIVADNSHSPSVMSAELRELLVTEAPDAEAT